MFRFSLRSSWKKLGLIILLLSLSLVSSFYLVPLPERLSAESSSVLLYRDGSVAHIFLAPDERWRTKVDLDDIDPQYIDALLAIEDSRFYQHPGFDPISIFRAFGQNIASGKIISGASTLTMQLVRIVEPRPRTYTSKLVEIWRAMQLEFRFSKQEILEQYLSFIPFGRNIEGLEAASLAYFGHLPNHLEAEQISLLIAIPQNPNARVPSIENKERLTYARNHVAQLLDAQNKLPIAENESIEAAVLSKDVPLYLLPFPRECPHLAMMLKDKIKAGEKIHTTLDKKIQAKTRAILNKRQASYQEKGIHNGAILVLDKETLEYRAMIGNFDYWTDEHAQKIPAFAVERSAGSTLKPFLYAQGIDLGIANPARKMEDIPISFRGYRPKNYTEKFSGLISLEDSLSQSLNIPFIQLLDEISLDEFLRILRRTGISRFMEQRHRLGLSVAVGLELTPIELNQGYLTLANQGVYQRPHFIDDDQENRDELEKDLLGIPLRDDEIFSQASAWLTEKALQKRDRPDFPTQSEYTGKQRPLAWKTGTSFGFHDAWTSGWGDKYVTTVWFGNLDYSSSSHLIGSEIAGTVFFDVMEQLEKPFLLKRAPPDLIPIEVCSYSGLIPTDACTEREHSFARMDRVPTKKCPHHHFIHVNEDGERVNPSCQDKGKQKSILIPSPEYQRWSRLPNPLPKMAEECSSTSQIESNLLIRSPRESQRILLLDKKETRVPLRADYLDQEAKLYWFVDGDFLGAHSAKDTVWWFPKKGTYTITVEDDWGHKDQVTIAVDEF